MAQDETKSMLEEAIAVAGIWLDDARTLFPKPQEEALTLLWAAAILLCTTLWKLLPPDRQGAALLALLDALKVEVRVERRAPAPPPHVQRRGAVRPRGRHPSK